MIQFVSLIIVSSFVCLFAQAESQHFNINSKELLKKTLEGHIIPLDNWIEHINYTSYDLICFGETHNSYFRSLASQRILTKIKATYLAIEDQQEKANQLMSSCNQDHLDIDVTGTPFNSVAQAFLQQNPKGQIIGIEATQKQNAQLTFAELDELKGNHDGPMPSRDSYIASNLDRYLLENQPIFAVYGATHCSYFADGLGFDQPFVRQLADKYGNRKKITVVHTITPKESSLLKVYLKGFGLFDESQDLIFYNSREIPPEDYNYNMELFQLFSSYDVIYFPAQ